MPAKKRRQLGTFVIYLPLLFLMAYSAFSLWKGVTNSTISYSEYEEHLKKGRIEEVTISGNTIAGKFKQPLPGGQQQFTTTRVEPELAKELSQYGIKFTGITDSSWTREILSWVLPALIFFGVWMFISKRMGQGQSGTGLFAAGKSHAKIYAETNTRVTFNDVAGVDEAKDELKELVSFLKNPASYGRLGARMPRGVLLVGPPGTGKTLLARAVAGEAGVPFFSISGAEFVEMFVGVGAARVRDLFDQARKKAPAIIFIDELDALGRARGGYSTSSHDEKDQTLNQLLSELDGFDPAAGLVLLAATNRPEILDPALLRAGRFDRQVLVDRPDKTGRVQILRVHLPKVKLSQDVQPEDLAALTPGFSGADLANLVNEAALLATRRNATSTSMEDFTQAVERIVAGLEKRSRILSAEERKRVAYHEMGHALVAMSLKGSDPVHKISIIPRGIGALGYTIQRPTEDRFIMTRTELQNRMVVLLGGRASEQIVFGEISTGAGDDLAKATDIARSIVMRYGMEEKLGPVTYESEQHRFLDGPALPGPKNFSEDTAREIDHSVRDIVKGALNAAIDLLKNTRALLERGAEMLLQKETLGPEDLKILRDAIQTLDDSTDSENHSNSNKQMQVS